MPAPHDHRIAMILTPARHNFWKCSGSRPTLSASVQVWPVPALWLENPWVVQYLLPRTWWKRMPAPHDHRLAMILTPAIMLRLRIDFIGGLARVWHLSAPYHGSAWNSTISAPRPGENRQQRRLIIISRMIVITLAMEFKADFTDKCLALVSVCAAVRTYMEFTSTFGLPPGGKDCDPLMIAHSLMFLSTSTMNRVQGRLHQHRCR